MALQTPQAYSAALNVICIVKNTENGKIRIFLQKIFHSIVNGISRVGDGGAHMTFEIVGFTAQITPKPCKNFEIAL